MPGVELPDDVPIDVKEQAMDEAPVGIAISDPDREDNPLVYVNQSFAEITGYEPGEVIGRNCRFLQGPETAESPVAELRRAIDAGETTTVEVLNYRQSGESFWNEVTVAPLRDADGTITNYVGFQDDVTDRKEAELALVAERERLDDIVDRTDRLLSAVTESIVRARSRAGLEADVCDRLVDESGCSAAWLGRYDVAREAVERQAVAGEPFGAGETVPLDGGHPIATAATDATVVRDAIIDGVAGSLVAIPLTDEDRVGGVLALAAPEAVIDERGDTVLAALGRALGAALSVHETRRILTTDEVTEVELAIADADCFAVAIAEGGDCRVTSSGAVADGATTTVYLTVDGATGEAVSAAVADCADVGDASILVDRETGCVVALELTDGSLLDVLAENGADVQSVTAVDGVASVEFALPISGDVRGVFDAVADRYDGTRLVSTRSRERPPETKWEYIDRLEADLTDRQLTALRVAYAGGYFDPDRGASGGELAAAMDVGRSTFHQHLRAAERKVLAAFFDE